MKANLFILVVVSLSCLLPVLAQQSDYEEITGPPDKQTQTLTDALQDAGNVKGTTSGPLDIQPAQGPVADVQIPVNTPVSVDQGALSADQVDSLHTRAGAGAEQAQNVNVKPDGTLTAESASKASTKDASATNVNSFEAKPNGDFTISSAESVKWNSNLLTNAKNVKFSNGILTADSALIGQSGSARFQNAQQISIAPPVLSVSSADLVVLDCARAENVKDSTFTLGASIGVQAKNNVSYEITDCAKNRFNFTAKENAKLTLSKRTDVTVHNIENASLELKHDGTSETIDTTGRVEFEVGPNGIARATLTPVSSYTIRTGDVRKDFTIKTNMSTQTIFLKKVQGDPLPNVCSGCTKIDIPGKTITTDGYVQYIRTLTSNGKAIGDVIAYEGFGNAVISLDSGFNRVESIRLLTPAWSRTRFNKYIWLEEIEVNDSYHRFLGVNEYLDRAEALDFVVLNYSTAWSNATSVIESRSKFKGVPEFGFYYARDVLQVDVLLPESWEIPEILKGLNGQQSLLAGSVLLLVPFLPFFWKKRGQITVFIALGVIFLFFIGLIIYVVTNEAMHPLMNFDKTTITSHVNYCLEFSSNQALAARTATGAVGVPDARFHGSRALFDNGNVTYVNEATFLDDVSRKTETRFDECLRPQWFGSELEMRGEPNVTIAPVVDGSLGEHMLVLLKHNLWFHRNELSVNVLDAQVTTSGRVRSSIQHVNAVLRSQKEYGLIDLDAIDVNRGSWHLSLFPENGALYSVLKDTGTHVFMSLQQYIAATTEKESDGKMPRLYSDSNAVSWFWANKRPVPS